MMKVETSGVENPVLPPLPEWVEGVQTPVIDLNDSSGRWEFLFSPVSGIPAPDQQVQGFDPTLLPEQGWVPVAVPGELAMQGFDIQNNTEYYYRRRLSIPADFAGKQILLQFDGVYSNARCWIDGQFIRSHTGGFTSWVCDLTPYVSGGQEVSLVVGVADLEGSFPGIYNPSGRVLGNPSWASYYAHHNIGGILRDVMLFALPRVSLEQLHVQTVLSSDFRHAELHAELALRGAGEGTAVTLSLFREGEPVTKIRGIGQTRLTLPVEEPALWDAEHPNLYLLKAGVEEGGRLLETVEIPVGFRQIHYGGRDGTDPSCVYINGREIKLRGVCRHDVSPERGRSTTREEDWQEILAYRDANINHIRTSHYPPSRHLLEACDRLGMYVEEENGACFQGANGYDVHASAEDFLNPFKEMVQRDFNHPSVIIWSLGNESSFERTEGYRMEYDYIKEKDSGRPVIFSYPYTVETAPLPYDICSRHYESFGGVLGSPDMPVLHDEFAHISCYNLQELQADPNVRNHWGSSLQKAWEKLFTTRGALGADLWCSIDDVFMLPETVKNRWQTHSAGRWTGYGPWGSVLDCHRRLKPEAYLTKKAFSPIRLDPRTAIVQGDTLLIPVKNWFDHTNLRELELSCRADGQELPGQSLPEVEPHGEGVLILLGDWSRWTEVSLSFRLAGREIDSFCIRLKKPRPLCFWNSLKAPRLEETPEALRIYSGETVFTFSRRDACLDSVSFRETRVISGEPHLHLKGVDLGRWMGNRTPLASVDGNRVTVVLQGHYGDLIRLQYLFRIYGDGYFTVEYHMHSCQVDAGKVSEVGLRFDLAQEAVKICWEKESLYSVYPGDHIGRNSGTAERVCPQALEAGYGVRNPQWGWKDDMYDAFLFGEDDPAGGRATRDFLAMRENIRSYGVKSATGEGTLTVLGEGDTAVRLGDRNSLIVNQQWYYPQLGWGNDSGRPVTLPAAGARGATAIHVGEPVGCPEDF